MRFTDLFIRRPVLAIVVNLVIIIAGLQAIRTLNVRQYPRLESATVTRTHCVRRRQRRARARLHHHAAGTLDRGGRRHRLHRVAERPGPVDHQRAVEAQLPRRRRAAPTSARASNQVRADLPPEARDPGDQHRALRRDDRRDVSELRLRPSSPTIRSPTT